MPRCERCQANPYLGTASLQWCTAEEAQLHADHIIEMASQQPALMSQSARGPQHASSLLLWGSKHWHALRDLKSCLIPTQGTRCCLEAWRPTPVSRIEQGTLRCSPL